MFALALLALGFLAQIVFAAADGSGGYIPPASLGGSMITVRGFPNAAQRWCQKAAH